MYRLAMSEHSWVLDEGPDDNDAQCNIEKLEIEEGGNIFRMTRSFK